MRLGNARTIADLEFVIDGPTFGSDETRWTAFGADCSRNRHRFLGDTYSFAFDVVHIRKMSGKKGWHIVIVSELWEFKKIKGRPRGTKSLKLIKGKSAEVIGWLRDDPSDVLRGRRSNRDRKISGQAA
jgi:hypothetical protein